MLLLPLLLLLLAVIPVGGCGGAAAEQHVALFPEGPHLLSSHVELGMVPPGIRIGFSFGGRLVVNGNPRRRRRALHCTAIASEGVHGRCPLVQLLLLLLLFILWRGFTDPLVQHAAAIVSMGVPGTLGPSPACFPWRGHLLGPRLRLLLLLPWQG